MFNVAHLDTLRLAELDFLRRYLPPPPATLLEIGAGTGRQGLELRKFGYQVEMIDLASSNYAAQRLCAVTDYDGRSIPFADATFDVVYSSNVLEHVSDLSALHGEIRRVLRRGGYAVHLVPTHGWRLWTIVAAFPAAVQRALALRADLLPREVSGRAVSEAASAWVALGRALASAVVQRRHGERGNTLTELLLFRPAWWRRTFAELGFRVCHQSPTQLFYTGSMVMGARWSIERRQRLARILGSACELFVVAPDGGETHADAAARRS